MNISVDAKEVTGLLKELPYKFIMLLISVISAILVFLPDQILDKLFLLDLRNTIGTFLGLLFLISTCITIFLFVSPYIKNKRFKRNFTGKRAKDRLMNLANSEKQIVAFLYYNQGKSVFLPSDNTTIIRLKNLLVISEARNFGSQVAGIVFFPYYIQQWVIDSLKENPTILYGIDRELPEEFKKYEHLVSI